MELHSCTLVLLSLLQFCEVQGGSSCSCRCTRRDSDVSEEGSPESLSASRIFSGERTIVGGRPFQVGTYYGGFSCGGSIYNSQTFITAAHCLAGKGNVSQWHAYVGSLVTPTKLYKKGADSVQVLEVIPHPKWGKGITGHDIGLIKLAVPIKYNWKVQPIGVAEPGVDLTGKAGVVSGWGVVTSYDEKPRVVSYLKQAVGTILSREECERRILAVPQDSPLEVPAGPGGETLYKLLCTQTRKADGPPGQGSCKGDSGGPLTCQVRGSTKLCGIVAAGFGCGAAIPQTYTEVNDPEIFKWILDNAGKPDTPTKQYD